MDEKYLLRERVFKAFTDRNRLMILDLLQEGEKCACGLLGELRIGQSTLSHHMRILCDSGIVNGRKEGKWMYYSISREGILRAKHLLDETAPCSPGGRGVASQPFQAP